MTNRYSIKDFLETKTAFGPSFSPDGSKIAYLSNLTGTWQVYIIPTEGGEPIQLTNFDDNVTFVSFSPKENLIIFGKSEGGNENTQLYFLESETKKISSITDKKDTRYNFSSWSYDGSLIAFSSNQRNKKDFDVYVMDVATRNIDCVYNEGGSYNAAGFSPQHTYLVLNDSPSNFNNNLYLYNFLNKKIEYITPHTGDALYGVPRWLPDESSFFVTTNYGREFIGLARYSLGDKKLSYVLTPEWDVDAISIQKDAKYLATIVNQDGYKKISLYVPNTLKLLTYTLPEGETSQINFSKDGKHMSFILNDSHKTSDIWILDMETGEYFQLTKSPQGVPPEIFVEPQLVRFKSFDNLSIPTFIYFPKDIKKGEKLPVIIDIHGGPEAQYSVGFRTLTQYYVYKRYIVVAPNVRGSSGYGKTYLSLDNKEKRLDSLKDIVALRNYLATLPGVDVNRIALMGASYGGFMVLAALAFYPGLWAAGIDIVGIANFVTFLENTAPYRRARREAEYGSLEQDRELLESISPINKVENIEAPLFVIHGANDPRVPLSEAEQIVSRLKEKGKTVELLVYLDEGHGLSKLKNRLDAYPKVVSFLEKVLK